MSKLLTSTSSHNDPDSALKPKLIVVMQELFLKQNWGVWGVT